jgi:hypothetical protein
VNADFGGFRDLKQEIPSGAVVGEFRSAVTVVVMGESLAFQANSERRVEVRIAYLIHTCGGSFGAAFLAGAINSVAGGRTLVSFRR